MRREIRDRVIERSIAGIIVGVVLMVIAACFGIWYHPFRS
jgi:hypothetical protein